MSDSFFFTLQEYLILVAQLEHQFRLVGAWCKKKKKEKHVNWGAKFHVYNLLMSFAITDIMISLVRFSIPEKPFHIFFSNHD